MKRSHLSSGLFAMSMLASAGLAQTSPTATPTSQPDKSLKSTESATKVQPIKKDAQDAVKLKDQKAQPGDEKMPAEVQEWLKLGEPGPMHDRLQKCVGTWDCKVSAWMDPTSEKPTVNEGKAVFTPMFAGRFVRIDFSGVMMGMPFKGFGLVGYDNAAKKFQSIWADSMVSGMMVSTGDATSDTKTINWTATVTGPDGKPCTMRQVETMTDDDHFTFTMYNKAEGQPERKEMMIEYTRAKKASEAKDVKPDTAKPAAAPTKAPAVKPVETPKSPK